MDTCAETMPGTGVSAVNTAFTQCWQLMPLIRRRVIIRRNIAPNRTPVIS